MKTKRRILINDSLVHGICNFNCITCAVNKSFYSGPKEFQSIETVKQIVTRIKEARSNKIFVKNLDISGDGEPLLHPQFDQVMKLFSDINQNINGDSTFPVITVVTNGYNLGHEKIKKSLIDNQINLHVSFPTANPNHYEEIMTGKVTSNASIFRKVISNIETIMRLVAQKKIPRLDFHVAPPVFNYIRPDFDMTLDILSRIAANSGLLNLSFEMFVVNSNRAGAFDKNDVKMDDLRDIIHKYNFKRINGVTVNLYRSSKRYFSHFTEILDVVKSFKYPCLWNANLFITAKGDSVCCNDQMAKEPLGSVWHYTLKELIEKKENNGMMSVCEMCGHSPEKTRKLKNMRLYHLAIQNKKIWLKIKKVFKNHFMMSRRHGNPDLS